MSYGYWGWEDRRRFQRLKVNLSVYFKIENPFSHRYLTEDKEIEATMLNISSGGMAFLTRVDIPIWSTLLIRMYLFKGNETGLVSLSNPVELVGEVRSNVPSEFGEYRLGICFKEIHGENKYAVSDYVESIVRPSM